MIKRLCVIVFAVCVFLCSCNNKTACTAPAVDSNDTATAQTAGHDYSFYTTVVIDTAYADTIQGLFSNDTTPDLFTFYMPAGVIDKTTSVLRVVNPQGVVIYEHMFATKDLIDGYALEEIKTAAEMKQYMAGIAAGILGNGLVNPDTLTLDDFLMQDIDFINKDAFTALKGTRRVYLHYCLNEEWHHYMVYNLVTGKVVPIADCC